MKTLLKSVGAPLVILVSLALSQTDEVFRYDAGATNVPVSEVTGEARDAWLNGPTEDGLPEFARTWLDRRSNAGAMVGSASWARFESPDAGLLAWDEYSTQTNSFDVIGAFFVDGKVTSKFLISSGYEFEARPSVGWHKSSGAWVAFEVGPRNWGGTYRSVDRRWNNATDDRGPLHSWRSVKLFRVQEGGWLTEFDVPLPAFDETANDTTRRANTSRLGVFYERPVLAFTDEGVLALALRHMTQVQLAAKGATRTHIEQGFTVDVRFLGASGMSDAFRLDERQRSGTQRLTLEGTPGGVALVAEVGRIDRRRKSSDARVVAAEITSEAEPLVLDDTINVATGFEAAEWRPTKIDTREQPTVAVDDQDYTLLFGDLHRHTDLSLCFPFYDGSLDDAYRYAIGPAQLDFVAITDHARDLDRGNASGRPWQLTREAVERHHRPGTFAAFYSYERSQNHTDHNVISLRDDVLRPHSPPLRKFWAQFSGDEVITIPHATSHVPGKRFSGDVWTKRDDSRRMLAEVYQSYRDVDSFDELRRKALGEGHPMGFIASSDHLATSSAYACVWTAGTPDTAIDRAPIFEAMRARRTFGATARIDLRVMSGTQWMGEQLEGEGPHQLSVSIGNGTSVERIEFWTRAGVAHTISPPEPQSVSKVHWTWNGLGATDIQDYCAVVVYFDGGERAWASPFFIGDWPSSR